MLLLFYASAVQLAALTTVSPVMVLKQNICHLIGNSILLMMPIPDYIFYHNKRKLAQLCYVQINTLANDLSNQRAKGMHTYIHNEPMTESHDCCTFHFI